MKKEYGTDYFNTGTSCHYWFIDMNPGNVPVCKLVRE